MNVQIANALVFAAIILAVAFFGTQLQDVGVVQGEPERLAGIVAGLVLIWFGNAMPKTAAADCSCGQQPSFRVKRFAGATLMLAGLVHAGVWLFAPADIMAWLSTVPVILGLGLIFTRAFRARAWF
ncbi:MAG: hypothetical protein AAGH41_05470 [Pseudomonadota bacterium]